MCGLSKASVWEHIVSRVTQLEGEELDSVGFCQWLVAWQQCYLTGIPILQMEKVKIGVEGIPPRGHHVGKWQNYNLLN